MALDGHDKRIKSLIDRYGLKAVLYAIADICDGKADKQDSSKWKWKKIGNLIRNVTSTLG